MFKTINMKKKKITYSIIILLILGIFTITSFFCLGYSHNMASKYNELLSKQIIWYVVGFSITMVLILINPKNLFRYSIYIYSLNVLLLILVLFFNNEINGIKAWINLGFFSIQPSEFMKISLCIMLSSYLSNKNNLSTKKEIKVIFISFIIFLIPSILTFLEPDTGAVIIYFIITIALLFFSNIRLRWFLVGLILIVVGLITIMFIYKNNVDLLIQIFGTDIFYRIDRVLEFKSNNSYQLNNALINLSSSGYLGHGIKNVLVYFPESPTDFIFALIVSLFGILGGIVIGISYFILDILIIKIIKEEKSNKMKLLLIGLLCAFIYQCSQNILMNIGLTPIIGIPLPFISYGGSSLITYFIFIGLVFRSLLDKDYL